MDPILEGGIPWGWEDSWRRPSRGDYGGWSEEGMDEGSERIPEDIVDWETRNIETGELDSTFSGLSHLFWAVVLRVVVWTANEKVNVESLTISVSLPSCLSVSVSLPSFPVQLPTPWRRKSIVSINLFTDNGSLVPWSIFSVTSKTSFWKTGPNVVSHNQRTLQKISLVLSPRFLHAATEWPETAQNVSGYRFFIFDFFLSFLKPSHFRAWPTLFVQPTMVHIILLENSPQFSMWFHRNLWWRLWNRLLDTLWRWDNTVVTLIEVNNRSTYLCMRGFRIQDSIFWMFSKVFL